MSIPADAIYNGPPAPAARCHCGEVYRYSPKSGVYCDPCGWSGSVVEAAERMAKAPK